MNRKRCLVALSAATILAGSLATGPAMAGGFALHERSSAAQGVSFAGADSGGDDITFAGFNPATLGNVEHAEVGADFSVIAVDNEGKTTNLLVGGITSKADPGTTGFVPGFAAGYRLTDQFAIGLTVNSGFGLKTDYPNNILKWPWAAAGLETELITITTTPLVAWSPMPNLTVAAGPQFHYADATLTSAVGAPPQMSTKFPEGKLKGDTWEFGWQVGVLFKPWKGTSIGASYTSGYDLDINGDFKSPLPFGTLNAKAKTSLPGVFGLGIRQDVTDRFRVMGEFQYYNWSEFNKLKITIAPPIGDASEVTQYEDSVFVAAGAEFDVTKALTVRAGGAWDQTPTRNAFRSVRVPDADRWWISAGLSYRLTDNFRIDAAYSLLLADNTTVRANGTTILSPISYDDGKVHIFSIGGSLRF